MHADVTPVGAAVYDIAARSFIVIPTPSFTWVTSSWLPDNERLLVRNDRGILLANVRTRATKPLVPVGGYSIGRSVGVTADGRWITYTETGTEGEIWLASLRRQ
jgi:hypothetical protein